MSLGLSRDSAAFEQGAELGLSNRDKSGLSTGYGQSATFAQKRSLGAEFIKP
jgi:hypothetical protein